MIFLAPFLLENHEFILINYILIGYKSSNNYELKNGGINDER